MVSYMKQRETKMELVTLPSLSQKRFITTIHMIQNGGGHKFFSRFSTLFSCP